MRTPTWSQLRPFLLGVGGALLVLAVYLGWQQWTLHNTKHLTIDANTQAIVAAIQAHERALTELRGGKPVLGTPPAP